MQLKVPRLGEGADTGVVVNILVQAGDTVSKGDTVLELENEKAVAPIPAEAAGVVEKILVQVGDTVSVGQAIMTIKGGKSSKTEASEAQPQQEEPPAKPNAAAQQQPQKESPEVFTTSNFETYRYQSASGAPPPASPAIRKMAREIGLDLGRVQGSDRGGRITLEDVRNHLQMLQARAFSQQAGQDIPSGKPAPKKAVDFEKFGSVERKPLTSLRKKIGEQMSLSWSTVPHVTQFDEADVSGLLALRKKYKAEYEKAGANLTLTVFILRALLVTLKKYPVFNASIDDAKQEVVFKQYYNIGIAVDTENGLIVPVIRDAEKKSLLEIAKELQTLAEKTRDRKVGIEDLQGGSFTVSNQGSIGGGHFTPIVNAPEVAILGLGKGAVRPVYGEKGVEPRTVLPLSLSYDHRLIDGGSAARFITDLVQAIQIFDEAEVGLKAPKKVKKPSAPRKKTQKTTKTKASRKGKR